MYEIEAGGPRGRFEITGQDGAWTLTLHNRKDKAVSTKSGATPDDYQRLIDKGIRWLEFNPK